ncbi:M24 family metallopeptidase [Zobellella maritima]|uniref:M24 family metallopeptidase n=1 Tax=Zobellella maritima TaxID=2059725 RepID=UPI0018E4ECB2|nr:M24 family metallopeptidase [Zobellella maritima]
MAILDWHGERSDLSGIQLLDHAPESLNVDLGAVRRYRLGRVRAEMQKRDIGALIISDPVNIRYACGARNMQIFCARNTPPRYLRATEVVVGKLRDAIRPGITENELWSVLHQSVIAQNGDYCETRLLSSDQCTNPWFQETASNIIGENELIALDTDVVGCHGYYSDFSRTFHFGPGKPTEQQRTLYKVAYEQVRNNLDIIRPGMSFREYSEKAWNIPEKYHANRYYLSAHGVGMTGEYPYLYHHADYLDAGYDGDILPGMTLCVESYICEQGGAKASSWRSR